MRRSRRLLASVASLLILGASLRAVSAQAPSVPAPRPNILLIVADDLGYSDLGAFGSEISTPNLDALVRDGLQLTNFHVAPTCSPTRAMLITGVDNHRAGLGSMAEEMLAEQRGQPGYEGYLRDDIPSLPALLQAAGYSTYMAGKWHLGTSPGTLPAARGFDRSFALLGGGASHFDQRGTSKAVPKARYVDGPNPVDLPTPFYSSEFYANRLIADIKSGGDRPFFAYAAFTAPHWPLQAPREYIDKYKGRYDAGYDVIRKSRIERMKTLGLLPADAPLPAGRKLFPSWDELSPERKAGESRRMEVYAAMVEKLDFEIGRLIGFMKETGRYENTLIMFMSDNGAEGSDPEDIRGGNTEYIQSNFSNTIDNIGNATSFTGYGPNWADVSVTPFRMYKGFTYEGGIRSPAFVVHAPGAQKGGRQDAFASVLDLAPTFLELANVTPPATRTGHEIAPMTGTSLLPLFAGKTTSAHGQDHVSGIELFGRIGIRKGDMKLIWSNAPWGNDAWELFDLAKDPAEADNLADRRPDDVQMMVKLWDAFKSENNVYWNEGIARKMVYTNQMGHFRY